MAKTGSNMLLKGFSGAIGKQIVVKQYGDKTVITAYPDMSRVKPSKLQKLRRSVFAEAVTYAQSINNNPVKKAAYKKKIKNGQSVYRAAISEYMKTHLKVADVRKQKGKK